MKSKFKILILGMIILLTVWQGMQFIRFAADEIPTVWTWIGKPVQWRSAAYTSSENFADYIAFAHQVIPEDATVAIPSNDLAPWNFSFRAFLQFLLFPRDLVWCSDFSCLIESAQDGAYALIEDTQSTIQKTKLEESEDLLQFNSRWSILTPGTYVSTGQTSLDGFSSITQIAKSMIIPLLWLTIVAIPGLLLTSIILPKWRWLPRFFLGLSLGLGSISFLVFLGLLLTKHSSVWLIVAATSTMYLLAGMIIYWQRRTDGIKPQNLLPSIQVDFLEVCLILIALFVAFVSIGKGYWGTDGIVLWGAKGYGLSLFSLQEAASTWGTAAAKYPLGFPITISMFKTLFGDLVPESKILPVIFYLGIPLIVGEYFRENYKKNQYAWLLLIWVISPQIILQGSTGYANLPATFYLVSGMLVALLGFKQSDGIVQKKQMLALSGVLFFLSAWIRPEAAIMAAVVLVIFAAWKFNLSTTWMLYVPLIIFSLIWGLTQNMVYINQPFTEGYLVDGLSNVFRGNIKPWDLRYLVEGFFGKLLDPSKWGLVGWLILIMLLIALIRRNTKPETNVTILSGVLLTLAGAAIIYLKTYNPMGCDVSCMVRTAMERLVLPGIAVLWVGTSDYLLSLIKMDE